LILLIILYFLGANYEIKIRNAENSFLPSRIIEMRIIYLLRKIHQNSKNSLITVNNDKNYLNVNSNLDFEDNSKLI
jgi:hypothetical protein